MVPRMHFLSDRSAMSDGGQIESWENDTMAHQSNKFDPGAFPKDVQHICRGDRVMLESTTSGRYEIPECLQAG